MDRRRPSTERKKTLPVPLRPKAYQWTNYWVSISQRIHCFSSALTNQLMLFREITSFCCETRKKHISNLYEQTLGMINIGNHCVSGLKESIFWQLHGFVTSWKTFISTKTFLLIVLTVGVGNLLTLFHWQDCFSNAGSMYLARDLLERKWLKGEFLYVQLFKFTFPDIFVFRNTF
jgi:hypothetical protein